MPKDNSIKSVLIIGSGPIVIGQACEFDYAGSQSARSLREEGIEVILINSNPATIMTDPTMADHVYLKPLTTKSLIEILKAHPQIDAVLPTMGGQTALNLCLEADDKGIWKDFNVKMIGVDVNAINITEDREQFKQLLAKLGVGAAPAKTATSFLQGKEIAQEFGFPLVIRPSFTLGGTGAAFVHTKEEFDEKLSYGLEMSPIHEVLIDKALLGWKEYELELLRDKNDNVVIICSIENMDPMGIHTGDSITVAPAMTLSDSTFQKMRDMAILMMRSIGNFAGGCNVQFAVSPDEKEDIVAIEINPRVSRSSALASKATGYPIAKIATKLALGYHLDELQNQITKSTSALFEPTLDYVIVKIPRWNFDKFEGADRTLGLQMKSVGEVMGIGRSFQEALHKATQSLEIKRNGLGADGKGYKNYEQIIEKLTFASWDRVFVIYDAIAMGIPLSRIHEITKIDMWFLKQYEELFHLEREISKYKVDTLPRELLLEAKQKGYGDRQIAHMMGCLESQVYKLRDEQNINRVYKLVDTCAAEFTAKTPYYYSTFEAEIQKADGTTIKKEQKRIEYNENYCNWIINSIDTNKSIDILNEKETEVIRDIKSTKIYRPEKDFVSGITYYWQNDKYNVVFKENDKEELVTKLNSIYDIQQKWNTIFIFETPADFSVFDTYKKQIVSKKWTIDNAEKNYRPYDINHIGGDKFSISFSYYSKEPGIQPRNQIFIYAKYEDKIIQDLNEIMKE